MTDFYRQLARNPPEENHSGRVRFPEAVRDYAQSTLYGRLVSPGGPASVGAVSRECGLSDATVYAQASGRNPVTVEVLGGLAAAGDPAGTCRVLAGVLLGLMRQRGGREALIDLQSGLEAALYPPEPTTEGEQIDAVSDAGGHFGQVAGLICLYLRGGLSPEEKASLGEHLPRLIDAAKLALARLRGEPER